MPLRCSVQCSTVLGRKKLEAAALWLTRILLTIHQLCVYKRYCIFTVCVDHSTFCYTRGGLGSYSGSENIAFHNAISQIRLFYVVITILSFLYFCLQSFTGISDLLLPLSFFDKARYFWPSAAPQGHPVVNRWPTS